MLDTKRFKKVRFFKHTIIQHSTYITSQLCLMIILHPFQFYKLFVHLCKLSLASGNL